MIGTRSRDGLPNWLPGSDPLTRAAVVLARTPEGAALRGLYLDLGSARRRARAARQRGHAATVVLVELHAVDGVSLDPADLPVPAPRTARPAPRRRRAQRDPLAGLTTLQEQVEADDDLVDLHAFDDLDDDLDEPFDGPATHGQVVELDGDEDVDEGWRSS